MTLTNGTRLGACEITGSVGAGGMGEVFKAKDTRLGRDVAVKILPALFASDPDRLGRFEQEARAAAALNHPNILVVYDVGAETGVPYVVSELLEENRFSLRLGARLGIGVRGIRRTDLPGESHDRIARRGRESEEAGLGRIRVL